MCVFHYIYTSITFSLKNNQPLKKKKLNIWYTKLDEI